MPHGCLLSQDHQRISGDWTGPDEIHGGCWLFQFCWAPLCHQRRLVQDWDICKLSSSINIFLEWHFLPPMFLFEMYLVLAPSLRNYIASDGCLEKAASASCCLDMFSRLSWDPSSLSPSAPTCVPTPTSWELTIFPKGYRQKIWQRYRLYSKRHFDSIWQNDCGIAKQSQVCERFPCASNLHLKQNPLTTPQEGLHSVSMLIGMGLCF